MRHCFPGTALRVVAAGECMLELSRQGELWRLGAAGDSFNGAFLASFLDKQDFPAAVKAGQQCAAKVISRQGALIKLG